MKTFFIFIFSIIIVSCNLVKSKPDKISNCNYKTFYTSKVKVDSLGIPFYTSNSFTLNALTGYSIESMKANYRDYKLLLIPVANLHVSNQIDTIYWFEYGQSIIEFYRTLNNDFIQTFDVTDSIFKLYGCIHVGMYKDSIAEQFCMKGKINDTITIGDKEIPTSYTFYFKKNKLIRIGSIQYMD